ncbi:MAG: TAT-variant-translocated molybdopterin oxidoreductase, partial [Planctomycetes bacterium]|nr:TAT-variant-translocated molybdopterin oxidoreductase [Planctomycetota bacterium]
MPEFAHKNYWKSPEERDRSPVFLASIQAENPDPAPDLQPAAGSRGPAFERRDFLKLAGFAIGAGALAGCARAPERKARPYLVKPEEVTPGKACWYATVCGGCAAGCGALAKNREGRPIKLEGNPDHPLSRGGLCPTGQASVLGLYDSRRLAAPLLGGRRSSWARVDEAVRAALAEVRHARGGVRLLSETTTSPTEQAGIAAFLAGFTDSRHVIHDPISASALLKAHAECFGRRVLPRLRFEHARVIVSLDADFLGPWISPVEHAAGYALARRLDGPESPFCWHAQFEARLSLTGSRADRRTAVAPGSAGIIAAHLAAAVAEAKRAPWPLGALPESPAPAPAAVAEAARRLLAVPGGKALVVCGANDLPAQRLVAFTNHLLGAYGTTNEETTIDLERVSRQKAGDDEAISGLTADLEAGRVGALLVRGVNPVYDLPDG